jgi:hypothetical protein
MTFCQHHLKGKVALEVLFSGRAWYTKNYFLRFYGEEKYVQGCVQLSVGGSLPEASRNVSSQTLNGLLHDTALYIAWYCGASLATVLSSFCSIWFLFLSTDERSLQGYNGDSSDFKD